jgi:anti-sigma factor RsiW
MSHPWMDRLSEYMDGELAAEQALELERHVEACDVCRATLHDLREIVAQASRLEDTMPARDLWPGIAAAMTADAAPAAQAAPAAPARWLRPRVWRVLGLPVPQLAAAAAMLVSLSAGAAWWAMSGGGAVTVEVAAGTIVHAAAPVQAGHLVAAAATREAALQDGDVAELERALVLLREQLDPATIEVIERSLESIDAAIIDARTALSADPGNPYLGRQIANAERKKQDLLVRAQRVQRVGT